MYLVSSDPYWRTLASFDALVYELHKQGKKHILRVKLEFCSERSTEPKHVLFGGVGLRPLKGGFRGEITIFVGTQYGWN